MIVCRTLNTSGLRTLTSHSLHFARAAAMRRKPILQNVGGSPKLYPHCHDFHHRDWVDDVFQWLPDGCFLK